MTDFEYDVIDRLGRIETKLDSDFKALYGNGHPGLLDRMADIEKQVEVMTSKGRWIREWLGWLFGIINLAILIWKH